MSGTREGGLKVSKTIKEKYGNDYYRNLGRKGGSKSGIRKGFACRTTEELKEIGRRGQRNAVIARRRNRDAKRRAEGSGEIG